ncbi:DVU_1556 family methyltransferase [Desulfovibrio sp. JC010]|uniref:DVU_1556 family methyltransferase n=1 Tax=Desulfovibrio sp. JC010 TaxID=2593641 RepID=UPI0013D3301A|nr:class I SAM-dependent methyltransferase [Desulfovibrio sp. JC010]NDV25941.1 class I SAM-dependent methyltransferase [Desulfovibrio sp. JC010]
MTGTPLWEKSILRDAAGNTLRPGGFTLTDRAVTLTGLPVDARVLDVGCGLGATVEYLRAQHGLNACGMDYSPRQLAEAPADLPLTRADGSSLPFADSSFDAIFCECVLSLLPDKEQTISEFKRVLKENGKLIISDLYQRGKGQHGTGQIQCLDGSCANSPLYLGRIEQILKENSMHIAAIEDYSRLLVELAAKLVFAGENIPSRGQNCCERPGYMLMIATQD